MASKLMEAKDKVRELSKKALEVTENATMTASEQKVELDKIEPEIKQWCDEVDALQHIENRRKEFFKATGQDVEQAAAEQDANVGKSIGQQFVQSAGYKNLVQRGLKGNFTSGDIEIKTTLSEGTLDSQGPGYANVTAVPQLLPGVVDIRFAPLVISDLFPHGVTDAALIRYLQETIATNGAAATGEGQLYPESTIKFDKIDGVLHKLATFLPITDEMLEDWAQSQSYVDARLRLFVMLEEQKQLLKGDGTGDNITGILNRDGLAASIVKGTSPSAAGDNSMDAIYRQITAIRTTAFMEPDAIVAESVAWEGIILSKNSQGVYYANGPFVGQQPATLWGKRVAVTPEMDTAAALVGAFAQGAQVFRKGGLTVTASNSHNDYFQRGLTAIRAEERAELAVYRPGAFGTVTGL
jgi:HK97 family phage major capsid protein